MKHFILLQFILLASCVFSQKNQTKRIVEIKGNDTTIIVISERMDKMDSILTEEMKKIYVTDSMVTRVDVFIDSSTVTTGGDATMDSIKVKIGNMKIVILEDQKANAKGNKKMIIDERVIIKEDDSDFTLDDADSKNQCHENSDNPIWAGIGLNANGFLNTQNKVAKGSELGFLALDPARSIGIQANVLEKRFPIINDYVGITTGLGLQWNRYALKNNVDLIATSDTLYGVENNNVKYSKNTLSSLYLQAPLLLQINTNKHADESWTISAGIVGGLRISGMQKTKWEIDGNHNKNKSKDDFNFSPFQASLMALIGYGDWNLYMTYNLTDVFNQGSTLSLRGVNAGILLSFK